MRPYTSSDSSKSGTVSFAVENESLHARCLTKSKLRNYNILVEYGLM